MKITLKLLGGFSQYLPKNVKLDTMEVVLENGASVLDLVNKVGIPKDRLQIILINGRPFREPPEEKLLNDNDEVVLLPHMVGG